MFFTGPHRIESDATTLMYQASATVETYLMAAVRMIDGQFGKGYAEKNPALVGAFIQAASVDCAGAIIAQQVRQGLDDLGGTLLCSSREARGEGEPEWLDEDETPKAAEAMPFG